MFRRAFASLDRWRSSSASRTFLVKYSIDAGILTMTCVTAIAVFMSLRFGAAIAIFGLVGGFLTPALISSNEPSATLLLELITKQSNYGILELSLFGVLAIGSIFLAYFKQKIYGLAPLITCAASALILFSCPSLNLATILAFAILFTASGYLLLWKSANPKLWAILVGVASVGY